MFCPAQRTKSNVKSRTYALKHFVERFASGSTARHVRHECAIEHTATVR
jgi:hypothetical protein